MHVDKTKTIAMLGMMAALSTLLLVLGTIISVNTVFFTAAAAFLAGLVVTQYGMGYGVVFFFVCAVLDVLLNPNPLHVFLYIGFAGYLIISEGIYRALHIDTSQRKERIHRVLRLIIFAFIYAVLLIFFPSLIFSDTIMNMSGFYVVMAVLGILAWLIYDAAYTAFKKFIFRRFGKM